MNTASYHNIAGYTWMALTGYTWMALTGYSWMEKAITKHWFYIRDAFLLGCDPNNVIFFLHSFNLVY